MATGMLYLAREAQSPILRAENSLVVGSSTKEDPLRHS